MLSIVPERNFAISILTNAQNGWRLIQEVEREALRLAAIVNSSEDAIASFGGEESYRKAFSKDGPYGKWLRSKPILAKVDDTVFMHAGIDLDLDHLARRRRDRHCRQRRDRRSRGGRVGRGRA